VIVVDTSALMAIALAEPRAKDCIDALSGEIEVLISAGTVAEAMIVASRRGIGEDMSRLIAQLGLEVVPVTLATVRGMADAYAKWGKGVHPASLNFSDCFAYEAAKDRGCPLLYVGEDFSKTDIEAAL
jgi:ribonuclease VapC